MNIQKVLHDKTLTSTEKVIYTEVYIQNMMNHYCSMTNGEIGRMLNLSNKTISRSLTKLHKLNYLTVFNEGTVRIVKINKN